MSETSPVRSFRPWFLLGLGMMVVCITVALKFDSWLAWSVAVFAAAGCVGIGRHLWLRPTRGWAAAALIVVAVFLLTWGNAFRWTESSRIKSLIATELSRASSVSRVREFCDRHGIVHYTLMPIGPVTSDYAKAKGINTDSLIGVVPGGMTSKSGIFSARIELYFFFDHDQGMVGHFLRVDVDGPSYVVHGTGSVS